MQEIHCFSSEYDGSYVAFLNYRVHIHHIIVAEPCNCDIRQPQITTNYDLPIKAFKNRQGGKRWQW